MKRVIAILLALLALSCVLTGCSSQENEVPEDGEESSDTVNLMDVYSVTDPENLEYDRRVALYMPVLESDEHYSDGCRSLFTVLYGLDGKGVFMYSIEIYETEADAEAYQAASGSGEVDGTALVTTSDAAFFTAMESFVPDLDTWVSNLEASGMIEI